MYISIGSSWFFVVIDDFIYDVNFLRMCSDIHTCDNYYSNVLRVIFSSNISPFSYGFWV